VLGVVFTVISAAWFGVTTVALRRGMTGGTAGDGLVITVLGGLPVFLIATIVSGQLFAWNQIEGIGYGALAAAGIMHFLGGRYCTFRAYAAIGANRSSSVLQATALVSVLFALLFLDEQLTPFKMVGVGLVLIGPALAASAPGASSLPADANTHTPAHGRLAQGYAFAALSTLFFGTSPILIRFALEETTSLGVLGGLVAYAAAGLVLTPLAMKNGQFASVRMLDRKTKLWFLGGSFTIFLGHTFRFLALSVAPVTIVIPLLRFQTVIAVALGWIVNRRFESFHSRTMVGIATAIFGSIVLVI
jgi:drug/metabolite transporter (DMT)-like permease